MNTLVTGHDGFIGSYLARELVKQGHSVRGLSLKNGDIRNKEDVERAVKGVQLVYHLAAQTNVTKSSENPRYDYEVNFLGTKNIIEACRRHGSKLIFVSSAAVYGNPTEIPLKEDSPKLPTNFYGLHKYMAESLIGEDSLILRLANVYGIGGKGVINIFTKQIVHKEPIVFFNNGTNTRDYVHVLDIVKALLLGMKHTGIYNIGSGMEVTLNQIVGMIEKETGLKARKEFRKAENDASDVKRSCLDISKIGSKLGWKPAMSLSEGIKEIVRNESIS